MNILELVPNKIAYVMGLKCGSRTMLGYLYCLIHGCLPEVSKDHEYEGNFTVVRAPNITKIVYGDPVVKAGINRAKLNFINYPIRMCIVRDPVERFVSTIANKKGVPNYLDLNAELDDIIKNIDSSEFADKNFMFLAHARPQTHFYGKDSTLYTHIFNLKDMDKIKKIIEEESGTKLPNLHLNRSNKNTILEKITLPQIEWIKNRYKEDYEVYGKWM